MLSFLRPSNQTRHRRPLSLERLESREVPAGDPVTLGTAAQFAVLGLQHTHVIHFDATVNGDEAVSRGGRLTNKRGSEITGDVTLHSQKQYKGRGTVGGSITVAPDAVAQAATDALDASSEAAALTPTQSLKSVRSETTVSGNGGLNVISIKGDIRASFTVSGSASDVFIVNVSGSLALTRQSVLGLAGGVTADHVLYNFTGKRGLVGAGGRTEINGTLLSARHSFLLGGSVHGAVIGGGRAITLGPGAEVEQVAFAPQVSPPPPEEPLPELDPPSLSGHVFSDYNVNGTWDDGENGLEDLTVRLTGTDSQGASVSLSRRTDEDGAFSFIGLSAGTYVLTPPTASGAWSATGSTVGTVGGTARGTLLANGLIGSIVLADGDQGVGYNFGRVVL